uniref:C-type lectin domain-containing protein n=1 Tax=Poecilia mexicana TaxID=48701 RepID=A0A3B3X2Z4_9TELE
MASPLFNLVSQLYEFHYINEAKNWTEAQQYCREKHTDLVTVTNMKDMKRLINISAGYQSEAWIGLYYQTDGTRKWHWSQSEVKFNESETNWNTNEPNDATGVQNCGIIWKNLKWGDLSCNDHRYFLCYDENKTWTEAQSYCRENHTDLISGTKQIEDEEVKNEISHVGSNTYILTGLFRDTWRWSDGSSFSFRHWNKGFDYQARYDDELILIKENKTWEDALYYCRDHHHDLVTITNMEDQISVQQEAQFASTDHVWMGLHYAWSLDLWFWVSDEVVRYKNWASNEPMDDCDMSGAMETGGKHKWRKKRDSEKFNFICSK